MTEDFPAVPEPVSSESRGWSTAAHLIPLIGLGFIAPLVIWLMKRDEDPFVGYHAREALNFQISLIIYVIGSIVLMLVIIGFILLPVVMIYALVVMIIAGIKAANGEFYRYPLILRFVTG
ncbi:MAG: DUF4870 domain-containing protein [Actinomycetota bacterium]|nr:DUF4870 domain-containing protein [Actinomycetota bacterium]